MIPGKYAIDILNRRQNGSIEIKLLFPLVTLVWKYPTEIHLLFLSAKSIHFPHVIHHIWRRNPVICSKVTFKSDIIIIYLRNSFSLQYFQDKKNSSFKLGNNKLRLFVVVLTKREYVNGKTIIYNSWRACCKVKCVVNNKIVIEKN